VRVFDDWWRAAKPMSKAIERSRSHYLSLH